MPRSSAHRRDKPGNDRLSPAPATEARAGSATAGERWASSRSYHHSRYPPSRIAAERAERELTVSVCLPARECAATVAEIVGVLLELREAGMIDQIVVVDADSADGTAIVAERAGAVVWQERELMPSYRPVLGKGDAMWRALSVLEGELVCFLDADTEDFSAHFVTGLIGPLVCEPGVSFVKAHYRRPFLSDTEGGGRVNHLTARPALALFYPQLARVRQPLAGEVAARRQLLERLPFATGYGVEIAMLIDAYNEVGLAGIAQVDLEEHRNRHQPLSALAPMALTVLATIAARLESEGRLSAARRAAPGDGDGVAEHAPAQRPPMAGLAGEHADRLHNEPRAPRRGAT
jgi:glucosyl-3-phosphoglycerate synthase